MEHERGVSEFSACGVGFAARLDGRASREPLARALTALAAVEHRGGCMADGVTGDGAGVMTEIPFDLLGHRPGEVALASLMITARGDARERALGVLEATFAFHGLERLDCRAVPTCDEVLGTLARESKPELLQVFFAWPAFCRTSDSLETLLYLARLSAQTKLSQAGLRGAIFFASLSASTVVYKGLTRSADLPAFYPDLRSPAYKTRFALFHRRFSTNTRTTWDRAQPFRMIAHNGEINTIACNRSLAYSREQALGLPPNELLVRTGTSDSGSVNQMVEALRYRSSMPDLEDILAIMIPPAGERNDYYEFWSRAMEPWDGPAFLAYADAEGVGARLDRNGFRPARWARTGDGFYLASEAGVFGLDEGAIVGKGILPAGSGVKVELRTGEVHLRDPSESRENAGAAFDPRAHPLGRAPAAKPAILDRHRQFGLTKEEVDSILVPMIVRGKEPIASMGDTASIAVLSDQPRSFFDYFYQTFAQVTNPPLDYLRERMVTDLSTYLGPRPNIFHPKELLPLEPCLVLDSPVVDLEQMAELRRVDGDASGSRARIKVREFDTCFARESGVQGFRDALERIEREVLEAVETGFNVLVLSDRCTTQARPFVPALLALRSAVNVLNRWGLRLRCSIVVETGEVRSTHALSAMVSFGASAVCPHLAFELAAHHEHRRLDGRTREAKTAALRTAFEQGLLKTMSKMGISVVRSYRSSKLLTAIGLGPEIMARFFPGVPSPIGGISLNALAERCLGFAAEDAGDAAGLHPSLHVLREHPRGLRGERHGMTARRSKALHGLLSRIADGALAVSDPEAIDAWRAYLDAGAKAEPINLRHLLELAPPEAGQSRADEPLALDSLSLGPLALDAVEPAEAILARFGAGAMSFGAISAESQRDIFHAMRRVGGRSNSGEGGENPYYFEDGTTASTKQVASGRFGVTAEYLVTGREIEIKVAQGAKPGEGGQLMGVKVDAEIARARHARPGSDLISPPPLHDIYSIEDLKQLIHELRGLHPEAMICVKLVAGVNIGTIAAGVVKAGADVVQISGGDGGTGAAPISSMRHAGLPWELGLTEVHRTLREQGLRNHVRLRVDGGLYSGAEILEAAALGADEFGFGKLLLVAEGCIMARVCEKNTCPRGIATHDPKFKAKYRGRVDEVVALLRLLAEDVRRGLAALGLDRLDRLIGRNEYLRPSRRHGSRIATRGIDLRALLAPMPAEPAYEVEAFGREVCELDRTITADVLAALPSEDADGSPADGPVRLAYAVESEQRALLSGLCGELARRAHRARMRALADGRPAGREQTFGLAPGSVRLAFTGSAGQGFGVFLVEGLDVELRGEANDSVAKSMSGGRMVIRPPAVSRFDPHGNAILGSCALYGATGGTLHVVGAAGARFAVRNSGATAVVDHVGLHACAYMTGGRVVVLGSADANLGSGMTGGVLYCRLGATEHLSRDYLEAHELDDARADELRTILEDHWRATDSRVARDLLDDWADARASFRCCTPKLAREASAGSLRAS